MIKIYIFSHVVCKEDIDKIIKIIEKTTDEEKVKLNAAKTDNPEVNTDFL